MKMEIWKNNLKWRRIPPFGEIHNLAPEELKAFYYEPANVSEVIQTIQYSLQEGYGVNNKRIIGEPGSGKTTFIYYLKRHLSHDQKIFREFSFHVLHLNRLNSRVGLEEVVEKRTLKLLSEYFEENHLERDYHTLIREERVLKEQINKIEDFILTQSGRFIKRLVVIIDDIDETAEEYVEEALRYFYGLLEGHQICKWLVVRNTTLDNYKANFSKFIDTKFATALNFPRVDLYGIINRRITAVNPDGLNPFTREICGRLLSTYNFDLRQSIAAVPQFFEKVEPLTSPHNSPSFIAHYLNRNFTKVMTGTTFPNIYFRSQSRFFPLEKDVFFAIALYSEVPNQLVHKLQDTYRDTYKSFSNGRYAEEAYAISFDLKHVKIAIDYLKNQRLIEIRGEEFSDCRLTEKGMSFGQFIQEKYYTAHCKAECETNRDTKHPLFWHIAKRLLNI